MKKLFISQPMSGLTDKEILEVRQNAIKEAIEFLGEDVEVLETFFTDFKNDAKPLHYLAKSIEFLADADVVYFARGWSKSRGCKIEQICAKEYGIECIYSLGI